MAKVENFEARTRLMNLKTFQLEAHIIGSMPCYVAISHVWLEGLFPPQCKDRQKARGMEMVLNAVKHSAELSRCTYCWTDTWCIDQDDPLDKARQIPLMGTIYQNAAAVVITLDHSFSFTQQDWDSVLLRLEKALSLIRTEHEWDTDEVIGYYKSGEVSVEMERSISMLAELIDRPWFTRVWTVQEYVLGRTHIWIGSNLQSLTLQPNDIDGLFSLWVQTHRGEEDENANNPEDPLYKALTNLYTMNTVRSGSIDAVNIMQLAEDHLCFLPQDKIYGLMAAAGVSMPYDQDAHVDDIWKKWWTQAMHNGHVMLAILPTSTKSSTLTTPFSGNCIMPHASIRCEGLAEASLDVLDPYTPTILYDSGTLEVSGQIVGKVTISHCIGSFSSDIDLLGEVTLASSGDEALLYHLARAMTSGHEKSKDIATWSRCQHAQYHSWVPGKSRPEDDYTPLPLTDSSDEEGYAYVDVFNKSIFGKLYLGKLTNYLKETDIVVIADSIPLSSIEGNTLLALDINARLGYAGTDPRRVLMIVQAPPNSIVYSQKDKRFQGYTVGTNTILHKVGTTWPVFFPENESIVLATEYGGHVHHPVEGGLERFWIGGEACEGCAVRKRTSNRSGGEEKMGKGEWIEESIVKSPTEFERTGWWNWKRRGQITRN